MDNKISIESLKGMYCDHCGTDLYWWAKCKKKKVYVDQSDTYFCKKQCFKAYWKPTLKDITEVKFKKEKKNVV